MRETGARSPMTPNRDPSTFAVRFVCGAIVGAVVALGFSVTAFEELSKGSLLTIVAVAAAIAGLAAARLGDRFWRDVLPWLH
jgi:uncharacterized membrane protein